MFSCEDIGSLSLPSVTILLCSTSFKDIYFKQPHTEQLHYLNLGFKERNINFRVFCAGRKLKGRMNAGQSFPNVFVHAVTPVRRTLHLSVHVGYFLHR